MSNDYHVPELEKVYTLEEFANVIYSGGKEKWNEVIPHFHYEFPERRIGIVKESEKETVTEFHQAVWWINSPTGVQYLATRQTFSTNKKYLCVGGPETGKLLSEAQAPKGYHLFNRSNKYKGNNTLKAVLVWLPMSEDFLDNQPSV